MFYIIAASIFTANIIEKNLGQTKIETYDFSLFELILKLIFNKMGFINHIPPL